MVDQSRLNKQMQVLKTGDEATRRDVIHALKQHERAEWDVVSDDLVHSLASVLAQHLPKNQAAGMKQPLFRQEVVTILGNIGPRSEPALPNLVELLDQGIPDAIREAVATTLGKIGKEARVGVDKLIAVLNSSCRIALADRVARALGDIGCADQRVRTALVNMWLLPVHSQSNQLQVAIALCKLRIDARGLLKSLTATLVANRDSSQRKGAAEALAWCSKTDLDVVPALTAALCDDDEEVRRLAEVGLTQMRVSRPKAIQLSAMQLNESVCAETALRRSGAASVVPLIEALKAPEPIAREKAARTLGALGEVALEAAPALQKSLNDKHVQSRLASAKALWNISKNADAVVPVLTEMLRGKEFPEPDTADSRRSFLQSVIEALHRIGPSAKAAIPALTRKTKDDNRLIRESAVRALKEIVPAGVA